MNIRQKGAGGEREVYKMLNTIIKDVLIELDYPPDVVAKADTCVQRNQNQTAVGGNDLTNTFGLSIEVKRQETLSINTWWQQCELAAHRNKEKPVLLYRQSHKEWKCVTDVMVPTPDNDVMYVRAEFGEAAFKLWFRAWVKAQLLSGYEMRS